MRRELFRKSVHVLMGLWFAYAPQFFTDKSDILLMCAGLAATALFVHFFVKLKLFDVGRSNLGALWYAIGMGLATYLFLPQFYEAYLFGVLVLTFADTAASLVGRAWGRVRFMVFGTSKSFEGSLAFFVVTALLLIYMIPERDVLRMVVVAVLLTHVELFSVNGLDNLTLPSIAGGLQLMLTM